MFIFLQQSFDHFWRKVVFCHLVTATRRFFWQSHAIGKSCICTFIFTIVIVICWAIWFLKFYFLKYNSKCFPCNLHPNHAISSQTDQWYFLEEHSDIQCMLTSDIQELDKTVIYRPFFFELCTGALRNPLRQIVFQNSTGNMLFWADWDFGPYIVPWGRKS